MILRGDRAGLAYDGTRRCKAQIEQRQNASTILSVKKHPCSYLPGHNSKLFHISFYHSFRVLPEAPLVCLLLIHHVKQLLLSCPNSCPTTQRTTTAHIPTHPVTSSCVSSLTVVVVLVTVASVCVCVCALRQGLKVAIPALLSHMSDVTSCDYLGH